MLVDYIIHFHYALKLPLICPLYHFPQITNNKSEVISISLSLPLSLSYSHRLSRRRPSRRWGRSVSPACACPAAARAGRPAVHGTCSAAAAPAARRPASRSPASTASTACSAAPLGTHPGYRLYTPAGGEREGRGGVR